MLFNSFLYILLFLPLAVAGYFFVARHGYPAAARAWLVLASFCFYGWWNPAYVLLLIASILVNFGLGRALSRPGRSRAERKAVLVAGLCFNLGLLGYYKYTEFILENLNALLEAQIPQQHIALPLAISFFTFQQVRYVVDCHRHGSRESDFLSYCLFVTFFPQLIAGPIVDHREMLPQFARRENLSFNWDNAAAGLYLFTIGLFKKAVLADTLAVWANYGFDAAPELSLPAAWATALSYTLQLYFDFSGYTDMAIGSALLLNIRLPKNFDSPYKALNIRDFWRRWHITLSRFLMEYLYIPLGGNRHGRWATLRNIFVTFLLGGIWHGAGWSFVLWGAMHGLAAVAHRVWSEAGLRLPRVLAWAATFAFVVTAWVPFRAKTLDDAARVLRGMYLSTDLTPTWGACHAGTGLGVVLPALALLSACCLALPSSGRIVEDFRPTPARYAAFAGACALAFINLSGHSEFLYFQF